MYSNLDTKFLTEFIKSVLVATNITKNIPNITMLNKVEGSLPLNDENLTMVESSKTTAEKTTMKISEVLLVRPIVADATIMSLILQYTFRVPTG